MNIEEFKEFRETDPALYLKNTLQADLAAANEEELGSWIEKYAEKFDKLFNPTLMDSYENDPEKTMENLKKKLYH